MYLLGIMATGTVDQDRLTRQHAIEGPDSPGSQRLLATIPSEMSEQVDDEEAAAEENGKANGEKDQKKS